ncbi:flavin reductase family protein [Paucidesulfovibrio longus]|uniref:flavin reductase family protein n=1 Tax=Paucidesulfovibrio longus TaxID=889 RepID=UPI0003B35BE2|nr:flavin reductase family protein [Paucidesulfovibrio longus]
MNRQAIGGKCALYPSLTTIVGAEVDGRPNWMTIAHVGIMNHAMGEFPQYLSIGVHPSHHTSAGIRAHGEFSINIPSRAMLAETDYVGIVSGKNTDKSGIFPVQNGKLAHAPMIADCPISIECRLAQTVMAGEHEIFIGEVAETWIDEKCLTEGKPDLKKVDPILFDFTRILYWSLGEIIGKPWNAGKALKNRER